MNSYKETIINRINSIKDSIELMNNSLKMYEDELKLINEKENEQSNNEELKEVMKEDIKEVINNTNEQPKKRGRKPKNLQEGGNECAIELNKAEPDKKLKIEKPRNKKHDNINFSYYLNTYTDEQREKCKERSKERYYTKVKPLKEALKILKEANKEEALNRLKEANKEEALKEALKILKEANKEEVKRGRGRPRKQ